MIKLLLSVLLLTPPVPINSTPNLCQELEEVLWEMVEEQVINKQEAKHIIDNCSLETYE